MTTAGPSSRHSHSPHPHPYRHHPYAKTAPTCVPTSGSTQPRSNAHPSPNVESGLPPSPPRSRRDASETPSIGLGVAFGGSTGGKWWDEELPPPPASLTAILDSFRKSGEGDRELLLSILGAKKAEEERLTALIQTRLTILQARLSLHSAAAAAAVSSPLPPPPQPIAPASEYPASTSPRQQDYQQDHHVEKTPSLSSSRSTGPGSVSSEIASPPSLNSSAGYMQPPPVPAEMEKEKPSREQSRDRFSYWQLPAPRQQDQATKMDGPLLPPILKPEDRRALYSQGGNRASDVRSNGSTSPREIHQRRDRSGSGLEMLLDAGMRVDSGEC